MSQIMIWGKPYELLPAGAQPQPGDLFCPEGLGRTYTAVNQKGQLPAFLAGRPGKYYRPVQNEQKAAA